MPDEIEIPDWILKAVQDITPEITVGDVTIGEELVFIFALALILGVLSAVGEASRKRREQKDIADAVARELRRHRDDT
jgi:hypothetical protein